MFATDYADYTDFKKKMREEVRVKGWQAGSPPHSGEMDGVLTGGNENRARRRRMLIKDSCVHLLGRAVLV